MEMEKREGKDEKGGLSRGRGGGEEVEEEAGEGREEGGGRRWGRRRTSL